MYYITEVILSFNYRSADEVSPEAKQNKNGVLGRHVGWLWVLFLLSSPDVSQVRPTSINMRSHFGEILHGKANNPMALTLRYLLNLFDWCKYFFYFIFCLL
jgi:hypothetical protein